MSRNKGELSRTYFVRMWEYGEGVCKDEELILEVAYHGLKYYSEDVQRVMLVYKTISDKFLDITEKFEIIKRDAFRRKINSRNFVELFHKSAVKGEINKVIIDKICPEKMIYLLIM